MELFLNNLFNIQLLLESGGTILVMILIASVLMWTMLIERYLFVYFIYPKQGKKTIAHWQQRSDRSSWYAHKIRDGLIAENSAALQHYLIPIKTLISALPMLGLLGTVVGMIQTFDVLTVFGTGNARGMAGGISVALITTMGGLLAALSGMYFISHLDQRVTRTIDKLADSLRRD